MRIAALILMGVIATTRAQGTGEGGFNADLEAIRAKYHLPALAALAMTGGDVRVNGAVGVRKLGAPGAVTLDDKWHIGSCTKSMTATLAAMFVEQGKLRWDTKIGDVFPELRETMEPSWQPVTLEMLLTHRSGAPAQPPANLWNNAWGRIGSPSEQRLNFVSGLLLRKTEAPPGTKYIYSNQGFAIAGAMIERVGGRPWEELMQTMLFAPCHMTGSGFGAPASVGNVDQPWGHAGPLMKPIAPGPDADNPPAIGPAGTVHCTLTDFARYGAMHALGDRLGTMFLSRDSFHKLHTPPEGQEYAGGWLVTSRPWAGGKVLTHTGSNTMFFCVIWVAPTKDAVFVAATNCVGEGAQKGTDEAIAALIGRVLK